MYKDRDYVDFNTSPTQARKGSLDSGISLETAEADHEAIAEEAASNLDPQHLQDWQDAGVDIDLTKQTIRTIRGQKAVVELLNLNPKFYKSYESTFSGGWVCRDIFKPDCPRFSRGRIVKYEQPIGKTPEPYLLEPTERIKHAIAAKYGVTPPSQNEPFKDWVLANPQIEIVVCEGVKKAGCVMTQTHAPTLALNGHTSAYVSDGDVRFAEYVHSDRTFIICFDNDQTKQASEQVAKSINGIKYRLNPISNDGKEKKPKVQPRAKLRVAQWFTPEKGIDDVYAARGREAVVDIIDNAIAITEWCDLTNLKLGYKPDFQFNSKKWQISQLPENKHLIAIKGAKGTGKTFYLEYLSREAKANGQPLVVITHRIQLTHALASRLGVTEIDKLEGNIENSKYVALCIDSLPKINPELFKGAIVIIDEVVQNLEHFVIGATCERKRQDILDTLRKLAKIILESGGKFVIADADLNYDSINVFRGLLLGEKPYIIENTYRAPSYKCSLSNGFKAIVGNGRTIKTPADVVSASISTAKNGGKVFIACTGQTEESKWGSQTLECLFIQYGITSVIRIDSDSVKDPDHPAFHATSRINELCDNYQVVIATSSIGTGVSIENTQKFNLISAIFTGVGSTDAARQFLLRVRDKSVPRLIYCADKGLNTPHKHLGTTPEQVKRQVEEQTKRTTKILKDHDAAIFEDYPDLKYEQEATKYHETLVAQRNRASETYKIHVKQGLRWENVEVIEILDASSFCNLDIDPQDICDAAKEITKSNVEIHYKKLVAQQIITDERFEELKGATTLTATENLELEKKVIAKRYGDTTEVTEELITKDKDGWGGKITSHYAATVGYEYIKDKQAFSANSQIKVGEGTVIKHDFNSKHTLITKAELIRNSQIFDLIEANHEFSAIDEKSIVLYKFLANNLAAINGAFGTNLKKHNFHPEEYNFQLIQSFAQLVAIESKKTKQAKIGNKRIREYILVKPTDRREEVFENWLVRDKAKAEAWKKRKRELNINKLLNSIDANFSADEFNQLKKHELFNEVWEKVPTNIRIQIINRIDGYTFYDPKQIFIDATDKSSLESAFAVINSWDKLAVDTETYGNDAPNKKGVRKEGLHKAKAQVRLIQISNQNTVYTFDLGGREATNRDKAIQNFKPIFNALLADRSKTIIGHNLNFDAGVWRHTFESDFNCKFADTLLGIQTFMGIYNGSHCWSGGYALGNLSQKFLGIPMSKEEQKSDWGQELTANQIQYAALDPHRNYLLWQRINELYDNPTKFGFAKLAGWDMKEAWQLECECIAPLAESEAIGMPIDLEKLEEIKKKIDEALEETMKAWIKLKTGITKPTQVQKLIEYLNEKEGLSLTKADKKSLADYKEIPVVKLRFQHSGLIQYQSRLKKLINSATHNNGRAKTQYRVLTGTGRTSSGGNFNDIVNIQSIPSKVDDALKDYKLPSLRSAFKKPENKILIVCDLAAAHGKLGCDFADDTLGKLVQNNDSTDAHSLYAIQIAQCIPSQMEAKGLPKKFLDTPVTYNDQELLKSFKRSGSNIVVCKQLRDVAKNIFYGKLNGASWRRIQAEIAGQLKLSITESQAKAISDVFENLYPSLTEYCKLTASKLEMEENQIWIDCKLFGISNIAETGQRLLFDLKANNNEIKIPYTNCIASQWSRTEATAMKKSLVLCYKIFKKHPEWEAKVINIVHDELNIECNETYKVPVGKFVAWIMARNFQSELKNGVEHGGVDFKNEHPHKYKLDNEGRYMLNEKGEKIKDHRFETSIFSMFADSWADK